jgi:hypothetical protein
LPRINRVGRWVRAFEHALARGASRRSEANQKEDTARMRGAQPGARSDARIEQSVCSVPFPRNPCFHALTQGGQRPPQKAAKGRHRRPPCESGTETNPGTRNHIPKPLV